MDEGILTTVPTFFFIITCPLVTQNMYYLPLAATCGAAGFASLHSGAGAVYGMNSMPFMYGTRTLGTLKPVSVW
jgi:hypothetical protein